MKSNEMISVLKRILATGGSSEEFSAVIDRLRSLNVEWYKCSSCQLFTGDDVAYFVGDSGGEEDVLHWHLYEKHPDGVLCPSCTTRLAEEAGL
jgi:hypothetical protein